MHVWLPGNVYWFVTSSSVACNGVSEALVSPPYIISSYKGGSVISWKFKACLLFMHRGGYRAAHSPLMSLLVLCLFYDVRIFRAFLLTIIFAVSLIYRVITPSEQRWKL